MHSTPGLSDVNGQP